MAKLIKQSLADDAVDSSKIKLLNNGYLRARNAADNADVDMIKVNASDKIEFATVPQVTSDASANNDLVRLSQMNTALGLKQSTSAKDQANGYAGLDSSGKIAASQLPTSVMEFKGAWNANSNSPSLADGTGNAGDFYRVGTAGTQDLGSGSQVFVIGDYVMYSGSIWEKGHAGGDQVNSVFGRTGVVVAASNDYTWAQIDKTISNIADLTTKSHTSLTDIGTNTHANIDTHIASTSNPHSVTKTQVGLGNVTNDAQLKAADLDTDNTLAANSDSKIASQKAVKSYVDTAISGVTAAFYKEHITLLSGDIIAGYIDLAHKAASNSMLVVPDGWIPQVEGADYTLSLPASVTRVTFAGDMLSLVAGDKITFSYSKG